MNKLKEKPITTNFVTKIDMTTGEVTQYTEDVYENKPKIKEKSLEKLKRDELMKDCIKREIGRFFMYFYEKVDNIDIPIQYKTRFIYLSSFLHYNEEQLVDKIEGRGNVYFRIRKDKLFDILMLSKSEFDKTVKYLKDNKLMYKDDKYYNISSEFSIHGENKNSNNDSYTRVFINNIRYIYQNCLPRNHKQLYYLFKLLPYVNKQSNIICKNVDEIEIKNIIPMNQVDIANVIGLNKDNTTRWMKTMSKFKIDNQNIIMKTVIDNDITCIIVNPKIYYSGCNIDKLQFIIGLFDMVKELKNN